MAELFESCQEIESKRRDVFLIRAHAVVRKMERDDVDSLIRFLVDAKMNELRFEIADEKDESKLWLAKHRYELWKNFIVEFDQLLKSILEKEPSNAR